MAATVDHDDDNVKADDDDDDDMRASATIPPSHILQDGTYANLPPPSKIEHIRFFERSIARHGLLEDDLKPAEDKEDDQAADEEQKEIEEPKIHPLALASARLQSNGISELNRAINLNNLAATGEYFGLTNIVESSATGDTNKHIQALYVLKQKRQAFQMASDTLVRHRKRLSAALVVQSQPDQRLRQLRPNWRIVAPEHGSRALPHAARPTEVIAADVDVYLQERASFGRLAKGVPRYATIELAEKYDVKDDLKQWRELHKLLVEKSEDEMDIDSDDSGRKNEAVDGTATTAGQTSSTQAEPFAMADPSLGKVDAEFDPSKVTMLTLQFDIEKPSTGFCQSHCLEPISSTAEVGSNKDEQLLVSLQHSLFCARLFESIRRELAPDTEHVGQLRTSAKAQTAVWLSGQSEDNFMPPGGQMISNDNGLSPLCVVHVHEGDVKVLLDCEYALRVRLVEPQTSQSMTTECESGSQTPQQLHTLCKILLVHGQEQYHRHSVATSTKAKNEDDSDKNGAKGSTAKQNISSDEEEPRILQNCVSLFTKIVFERRIRKTIQTVNAWISETGQKGDRLQVHWLALSIFDLAARFTVSFLSWTCDVIIVCDELTVTQLCDDGSIRKTQFHSSMEFELFLKTAIQRAMKSTI